MAASSIDPTGVELVPLLHTIEDDEILKRAAKDLNLDETYEFFDMCFIFRVRKKDKKTEDSFRRKDVPITYSQMQNICNSIIVPRNQEERERRKEEAEKLKLECYHRKRLSIQNDWVEGTSEEDLYLSLQKSFVSYLKKWRCIIMKTTRNDLIFYRVRMKEGSLQRLAQETRLFLQMDESIAEKYRDPEIDQDFPFISPFLEFDLNAEDNETSIDSRNAQQQTSQPSQQSGDAARRRSSPGSPKQKILIWQRYDIYGKKVKVDVTTKDDKKYSIFRPVDRVRLLSSAIDRFFRLDQMVNLGVMETYYVLHQRPIRSDLLKEWGNWYNLTKLHNQPYNDIREYFGENIGFYFTWLGFLAENLLLPGLIGLVVFMVQWLYDPMGRFVDQISNIVSITYSFYITIWSSLHITEWEKVESRYRIMWGMEQGHRLKTESKGFNRSDDDESFRLRQWCRRIVSSLASVLFVGFVLGVVCIIFSLPIFVQKFPTYFRWLDPEDVPKWTSITNVIFISIFDLLWCKLAYILTNFENWKYEEDFQQSLVFKTFVFRFINYFNSFFYLAFVKEHLLPCLPDGSCVGLLKWNLGMIFLTNFLFNFVEIGMPYFAYIWSKFKAWYQNRNWGSSEVLLSSFRTQIESKLNYSTDSFESYIEAGTETHSDFGSQPALPKTENELGFELDFIMTNYDAVYGILEDYMEIVLSFAFIALFSIILPIVPFLAYVSVIFEIRSDAYKLLKLHRRAFPNKGYGLGPWVDMLRSTCYIAITINIALSIFTIGLSKLTQLTLTQKLIIFMISEHVTILVPLFLQFVTSDDPNEIEQLRERMQQILERALWKDELEQKEATEAAYDEIPSIARRGTASSSISDS